MSSLQTTLKHIFCFHKIKKCYRTINVEELESLIQYSMGPKGNAYTSNTNKNLLKYFILKSWFCFKAQLLLSSS